MSNNEMLELEFEKRFIRPSNILRYEMSDEPLDIVVGDSETGLLVPAEDLELLLNCARWEIKPPFTSKGRSGLVERIESVSNEYFKINSYKLKGIGNSDGNVVTPPLSDEFITRFEDGQGIIIHMGINDDGSLRPIVDPPKPIGGLVSGRGKREFENAKILFDNSVPAVLPVAWGTYSNLTFQGKNMEFVILGLPSRNDLRAGELFESTFDDKGYHINTHLKDLADKKYGRPISPEKGNVNALKTVCDMVHSFGKSLSGFHNAGLLRFAGHSRNYSYNPETDEAILHDVDSSVTLDEVNENTIGLSRVRDFGSALFGLFHSTYHSGIYELVTKNSKRKKHNVFRAFLRGYFHDEYAALESYNEFANNILNYFDTEMKKTSYMTHPMLQMWFQELNFNLPLFINKGLMNIYNKTSSAKEFPLPYGPDDFERHYADFRAASQIEFEKVIIQRSKIQN